MADTVTIDSGSPERVAYDIWVKLRGDLAASSGASKIKQQLELYAVCRNAVRGETIDVSKLT